MTQKKPNPNAKLYRGIAAAVAVSGLLTLVAVWFWPSAETIQITDEEIEEHLQRARELLQSGNFAGAETLSNELRKFRTPLDESLMISGEAAFYQGRFEDALAYYEQVVQDGNALAISSLCARSKIYRNLGRLSEAEALLRQALISVPDSQEANRLLGSLMVLTGREREARILAFDALRNGNLSFELLAMLGLPELQRNESEELDLAIQTDPEDGTAYLGLAQIAFNQREYDQAIEHAGKAISLQPDLVDAHVLLGLSYQITGYPQGFLEWKNNLPANANEHSEIWRLIGDYLDLKNQPDQAIRCYWEAARIDPNNADVAFQISRLLDLRGKPDAAREFRERSESLRRYNVQVLQFSPEAPDVGLAFRDLIETSNSLGRVWEAWGWTNMSLATDQTNERTAEADLDVDLNEVIAQNPPQVLPSADLAIKYNLGSYPLPNWLDASLFSKPAVPAQNVPVPKFRDIASDVGIDFQYIGMVNKPLGKKLFDTLGGGVAIIDYDIDGWPDIYLPQRASLPRAEEASQPKDRLFRNRGDGTFQDVTAQAGLGDQRFSLGASVGDFDNDGLPDLLVANIGVNRLYRNMGDGTFVEVEQFGDESGDHWTTSCAIADVNRDGIPDLFLSNYISGNEVFIRTCGTSELPRLCPPSFFPAAKDQFLQGMIDGTFRDESTTTGVDSRSGRGLGLAIGGFEREGATSIFTANELQENYHLQLLPNDLPLFSETAIFQGLAFNADGFTQASRGIAVDDADGDGRIDFFVTGFSGEWNSLYLQDHNRFYADRSRSSRLFNPSLGRLSFGAQFIDPDCDGWPDLFVANGHVEDLSSEGIDFKMPPQFFSNLGQGNFAEAPATELGEYFESAALGRAVATLDWNRDGKQDLAVTHLDRPVSLLSNETENVGNRIELSLIGTDSARDAFGAIVEVQLPDRTIVKSLYAGSGYLASNQRQLVIGLGDVEQIDLVTVRWPSGLVSTFESIELNQPLVAIEGEPLLVTKP